ncbi:hypothetical protein [Litorisediminicola beolgyonensis]|uniref:Major facilitator superfamily (MFS) profile domain-containing protein n=1 Tax=Litorisediminicola beolgyonensis TaxID=1173614 RepID=A0ABW3ZEK9_9RHOB
MASFAIILGSLAGLCAGLIGWSLMGMGLATSFGLYIATSLAIGSVGIVATMRAPEPSPAAL